MSDSLSSSIPKIELPRVDPSLGSKTAPAGHDPDAAQGARPEAAHNSQPASRPEKTSTLEISLKYQIDEKTQDVTLLILDRASRKVIRSIPPEDMTKMDPGELLELFT
jgi:hypothetical protein